MSRTPISRHLVHDTKDVKENGRKFDRLVELFAAVARPYIKAGLKAEEATISPEETDRIIEAALPLVPEAERETLKEQTKADISTIPEEEVSAWTAEFAQLMVSNWLTWMQRALRTEGNIVLADNLLPTRQDLRHSFSEVLKNTAAFYPVNYGADFPQLMDAFAQSLLQTGNPDLPFKLQLDKNNPAGYRLTLPGPR